MPAQGAATSTWLGVEDHAAPGRRRRLDAEAEEREAGLEQDHVAHAEGRRDEERAGRVREEVTEDNPPPRAPSASAART